LLDVDVIPLLDLGFDLDHLPFDSLPRTWGSGSRYEDFRRLLLDEIPTMESRWSIFPVMVSLSFPLWRLGVVPGVSLAQGRNGDAGKI
jgi:hypothetical protein